MEKEHKLLSACLDRWQKNMAAYQLPTWEELPDLELYMDQVVALVGRYLALLAKADVLVQLPDWESSQGANRELGFALGTDKIVVSLDSLLGGGDGRGPAGDL